MTEQNSDAGCGVLPNRKSITWVALLLMTMTALAGSPATAADTARTCAIEGTIGNNQIYKAGARQPVEIGQSIGLEDRIKTAKSGRVQIMCSDKASIVIGAETDIRFDKLIGGLKAETFIVRLSRGITGFVIPLIGGSRFEVRTPSAVASVRSTEWTADVSSKGTAVFVRDGVVTVASMKTTQTPLVLRAGDGVDVTTDGQLGPIKSWPAKRVNAMNARLGFNWK